MLISQFMGWLAEGQPWKQDTNVFEPDRLQREISTRANSVQFSKILFYSTQTFV
jgi:hypothetical protein